MIIKIKIAGHYKICIHSNDDDLFVTKEEKIKFSLSIDTDQDELDG